MTDLLTLVLTERAQGVSVTPGQAPVVHLRAERYPIEGPAVSPEHAAALLRDLADTRQMRELYEQGQTEFGFSFRESVQFRVTARIENGVVCFQVHASG